MIKIQITDKDGNTIQDDELLVEDGDILLCQLSGEVPSGPRQQLAKSLHEGLKRAFEKAKNEESIALIHDQTINFKVLKIRNEPKPDKDIESPKFDKVNSVL